MSMGSTAARPGLVQRLTTASERLERVPAGTVPVVRLAEAVGAFVTIAGVGAVLSEHAAPRRDAFGLSVGWSGQALKVLRPAIGSQLVRKYVPADVAADVEHMAQAAQFELLTSCVEDVDRIAGAMIDLAATLQRVLDGVADDETALPEQRSAARSGGPLAREIWAHYGGDGGGW